MAQPFRADSHATARMSRRLCSGLMRPRKPRVSSCYATIPTLLREHGVIGPFITFLLIKPVSSKTRVGRKAMTISSRPLTIFAGPDMAAHVHLIDTEFITTISACLPFHALTSRFTRSLLAKRLNEKRAHTHWRKRLWLAYTNDDHGVELNMFRGHCHVVER